MKFRAGNLRPVGNGLALDLNFSSDCGCGTTGGDGNGGGNGGNTIVFWNQIQNRPECILDCNTLFEHIRSKGLDRLGNSAEITFSTDVNGIKSAVLVPRVSGGNFGSPSKTVTVSVNSKGVITAINEVDIDIQAMQVKYTPPGPGGVETTVKAFLDSLSLSTDKHYEHSVTTPASSWVINHNMNKRPSVTILTAAGEVAQGDIVYNSANQLTLNFSTAIAGKAYLN